MSLDLDRLRVDLVRDEGEVLYCYDDATGDPIERGYTIIGNPTVGIGRLLTRSRGLSERESRFLYDADVGLVSAELRRGILGFDGMPEPVQRGLANMDFNLGWPRFSTFARMMEALERRDYRRAAVEALDSKWARQVGARAERVAALIESGERA